MPDAPSQQQQTTSAETPAATQPAHQQPRKKKPDLAHLAQLDVLQLIIRFLLKVSAGEPLNFATFKQTWKDRGFSHIFIVSSYHLPLPALLDSLYTYLLEMMRNAQLPFDQIQQLARSIENPSTTAAAPPPPLSQEEATWASSDPVQGPPVVISALYTLYCLYYAQPKPVTVKIRVAIEHQQTMLMLGPYLVQHNAMDALELLKKLLNDKALLPASTYQPTAPESLDPMVNNNSEEGGGLVPGAAATFLTAGVRGKDAGTLREVRFHLNSTLNGLGTVHLDGLCRDYKDSLEKLWSALGIDSPPEGVADLNLGRWIHEYATEKSKEMQMVLHKGPNWRTEKKPAPRRKKGKQEKEEEEHREKEKEAGPSAAAPQEEEPKKPKKKKVSATRKRRLAAKMLKGIPGEEPIAGVPGIARKLLAVERARKADIVRKSKPWAELMQINEEEAIPADQTIEEQLAALINEEEDMPDIEGMQSRYADLAGKSETAAAAGVGAGTTTTSASEGINGGVGDGKSLKTSSSSPSSSSEDESSSSSDSDSDSSSSSSSSSSSDDSSDSDDDERVAAKGALPIVGRRIRVRGRGRGGRGTPALKTHREKRPAPSTTTPAVSGNAKAANKKKKKEREEDDFDVNELLRHVDDVLEDDANI